MSATSALLSSAVICLSCVGSTPDPPRTIEVEPGRGALAAALADATEGDTIALGPGRYDESVTVPGGVTIDGGDPDAVTVIGQGHAALTLDGTNITIRNVTVEGLGETRRGISGERSVRVERCRFMALPEAIAIRGAPLSDVVCCDFVDCAIAVRAIGDASPTVWGCRMSGGRIGVFALGGAPYVCNNLFQDVELGVLLVTDSPHTRVVRHNIFVGCSKAGIELRGGDRPDHVRGRRRRDRGGRGAGAGRHQGWFRQGGCNLPRRAHRRPAPAWRRGPPGSGRGGFGGAGPVLR